MWITRFRQSLTGYSKPMLKPTPDNKFKGPETKAFAPGGSLSTPKQRKAVPSDQFLMPAQKKYPYKVNGQISCNMLKAAMVRAAQNNETAVHSKAKRLYADNCESD